MSHKEIHFREAAREGILHGATELADALRVTLGPKARCVLIEKKWGRPLVCNDGVTIAKEVSFKDPQQNMGAQMMREAAERTGDAVGDGTTTSTLLAHAIFAEGLRNLAAGACAIDIKRGLDQGLKVAVKSLRELSRPVASFRERVQVATISARNDREMGQMVADAMEKVGSDGVVTVEEAKSTETLLEVVEGMQFDHGFVSPYFVNEPDKMRTVLENCSVLLYDRKLSSLRDLLPLLERVAGAGRALLVVAEDIDGEALATLVLNKMRGLISCCAVKAPGFGDRRREMLQDLAVLTGGQFVTEDLGLKLEKLTLDQLGLASRVIVDREFTTIVGGGGAATAIQARITDLRNQLGRTKSDYDREKLQERLARLSGGVAVIKVGAPSEVELKNKKEAFEDAISATRAAISEGIVPGGGLALLRAITAVEAEEANSRGDELTGLHILKHALEIPARQIAKNSAVDDGVVVNEMRKGKGAYGFDAARGVYVDLIDAGIIDPTKVVRLALENAVSVASVLLLTEATLTEVPEPPRADAPGGMQVE